MKRNILIIVLFLALTIPMALLSYGQNISDDSLAIRSLPSIPFLPDPLMLEEGGRNIPISDNRQWEKKKDWIKKEYQQWISGTVPPKPESFRIRVLEEKREGKIVVRTVELNFGQNDLGKMTLKLMIPPTQEKLPVLMTQWNHEDWARVAVRRGYIGCIYAGADMKDDTRNYNEIFPGYDFSTLMKRAWGASRVIDYLYQLPEVDTNRIAITGHSRNGKQSLMAAAFDTRIGAVVSSSGGTGGESTFRWSDDRLTPGSFDRMVWGHPDWFSSRLPWFIGWEQKLPVDQNSLMSLIAPRGLMMASAITESEGNPWGIEQSYRSVKKVYHFLNADSAIAILLRRGRHQHAERDIEDFIDFFDYIFGRTKLRPENKLYYDYSFEKWKRQSGERINPNEFPVADKKKTYAGSETDGQSFSAFHRDISEKIQWLLGEQPPSVSSDIPLSPFLNKNKTYPDDYLEEVIEERRSPNSEKMVIGPYKSLADNLWGSIYFPANSVINDSVAGRLPLVIFLHEYSYSTGYHRQSMPLIRKLTDRGFAVLAFDLIGFGTRIEEALHFYDRYPHWSLMGKMVTDTRNIINDVYTRMPFIDTGKIFLTGYSLGGTVSLIASALDSRIKGVAVVSAFSSLRNDNENTEGIRHYFELHGLIPRLGFFAGKEEKIPIDFDDILSCLFPKPVLVISPQYDKVHSLNSVREMMQPAISLYRRRGATGKLIYREPETFNNFPDSLRDGVADWLETLK